MKRIFLFIAIGLVCLTGITSCEDKTGDTEEKNVIALTGITLNPTSLTIPNNGTAQITATPVPANATGVWFIWSSADPSVATVYQDGTVYIKKYKATPTTITVKSGSVEATVEVLSKREPMTKIIVDDSIRLPIIGSVQQIVATYEPANTTDLLIWTSSNPNVATVDSVGRVTAVSEGTTNVTVKGGDIEATIVVSIGLSDIIVDPVSVIIPVGNNLHITATAVPEANLPSDWATWTSSNPGVATVDELGVVTGVSVGTTNVTVNYGLIVKSVHVKVMREQQLAKTGWEVISWSDHEPSDGGGATAIINDNTNDFWHSQWTGNVPGLPHWAIIDMAAPRLISKINTYRRNYTKSVWYYVGNDSNPDADSWTKIANSNPVAGSWTKIAEGIYTSGNLLILNASPYVYGRYLLIYLPDSETPPHTTINEIDVYGLVE
jgi:uncharacterized protein YjdB